MIKSMTGFGRAEVALTNKKFIVEIRSLNSKQLDVNLKMPSLFRQYEPEVRNILNKEMVRGKVELYVNIESLATQTSAHVNREAFVAYYKELVAVCGDEQVAMNTNSESVNAAILKSVLRFPDVISTQSESLTEDDYVALMAATREAVEHLNSFRIQEGAILIADLLARIDKIESYKECVVPFEEGRIENIKTRIMENLEKVKVNIDSNRLEQEMIYYMEKFDITEEKVRLTNHCKYFKEVAHEEESVGRKLGFIAQEIGREINTMGSKANQSDIQIIVVKMKDELEKIKEQLLNIL